jgi:dihydropteroate synthase
MIHTRKPYLLRLPGGRSLSLGERTLVMGIINVTPDSFADGGAYVDPGRAFEAAQQLEADGADLIDIGGESTRPGAELLSVGEELGRVLPVLERVAAGVAVPISVDTYKAEVARRVLDAGAVMINDISALSYDSDLARVVAAAGVPVVLMHNRGRSSEMYREARYENVMTEVRDELSTGIQRATDAGISRDQIVIDPGLGFAKQASHTFSALANFPGLMELDRPILVGPSRKSFLKIALGDAPPDEREWGTAAAVTAAVLLGAHIVRVHGVREMSQVVRVTDEIRASWDPEGSEWATTS